MPSGYAGAAQVEKPRDATFNERLNKVFESLQFQCERLERVMSRVNGTPNVQPPHMGTATIAQISPTHPLATIVEHLEAVNGRVADLATGIERIA